MAEHIISITLTDEQISALAEGGTLDALFFAHPTTARRALEAVRESCRARQYATRRCPSCGWGGPHARDQHPTQYNNYVDPDPGVLGITLKRAPDYTPGNEHDTSRTTVSTVGYRQ